MASKVVILALFLVALVGVAMAADTLAPVSSTTTVVPAEGPASDDVIGNTDGDDVAGAPQAGGAGEVAPGPLGSGSVEGPAGASSAGATLQASAVIGAAALAGYFVV